MKKNKRFILVLTLCFFLLSLTSVSIVFAQGLTETQSNLTQGTNIDSSAQELPTYIVNIYRVGVGIVAILAVVVIMWGGLLWIMAGGNTGQIDNAKQWISGAVLGLFIALTSYVILNTINPQLTNLNITKPGTLSNTPLSNINASTNFSGGTCRIADFSSGGCTKNENDCGRPGSCGDPLLKICAGLVSGNLPLGKTCCCEITPP